MQRTIIYVVPRIRFFSEGYRGRVMHALGIAEGFDENGWKVCLIGGKDLHVFRNDLCSDIDLIEIPERSGYFERFKRFFAYSRAVRVELEKYENPLLLVRYNISNYFLFCFLAMLNPKVQKVIEVNYFAFQAYRRFGFVSLVYSKLERIMLFLYDHVYVVSSSAKNDIFLKSFIRPIHAIPNGVTSVPIIARDQSVDSCQRLLYFGTVMYYWQWQELIDLSLQDIPDLEVHIFGDGPKIQLLKTELCGSHNVYFHGAFKRRDIGNFINPKTDVLYLPPKTKKDLINTGGLSTKAFDYMSFGLPILVPLEGELVDIYKDGYNCLSYERDSVKSILTALYSLKSSHDLRDRLAINAVYEFNQKYTWRARMYELMVKIDKSENRNNNIS